MQNIKENSRNYELDFLKFIFTLLVFIAHSIFFMSADTNAEVPPMLGSIPVHFFFIVSGMLMANSIAKSNENALEESAKNAVNFVIKKAKKIILPYWVSLIIVIFVYLYMYITTNNQQAMYLLPARVFPAFMLTNMSGNGIFISAPAWYLSAIFICMLPLAYLLYRKRNFALYVFSPLTAVIIMGYIAKSNDYIFFETEDLTGIFLGGTIRAFCGLCFGITAYTISQKIKSISINKIWRVVLTIAEVSLWLIFFCTWFLSKDGKAVFSVLMILPVAIVIAFSEQSYITKLFRFKFLKYLGPLSLSIYLNHWAAWTVVNNYFNDRSYKFCLLLMSVLTVFSCLINMIFVKALMALWNKKLKNLFTQPDNK